jgi:intergrase/recombinase
VHPSIDCVDWDGFRTWIFAKYSKAYAPTVRCYARKYARLLNGNLRELDLLSSSVKNATIKSLIILSKYLGVHKEFKQRLSDFGVKMSRPDAFSSFLRMYSCQNSDIVQWYSRAYDILKLNERVWQRFLVLSGLRKSEAITSFNKIIELSRENNLDSYLNSETSILEHFRFRKHFLRGTKNVYISILPTSLISEIQHSSTITYEQVRKRLHRNGLKCRFVELRDYYATFMVRHGLIKEEVDLLQGRIPPSIFIRHYWSPSFRELRSRTLEALEQLERQI